MLSNFAHRIITFIVVFSGKVGATPLKWNKKLGRAAVAKKNSFTHKKFRIAVFLLRLHVAFLWIKLINCHYNDQCEDDFGTKFIHFFMASSLTLPVIFDVKTEKQGDILALFINQMLHLDKKFASKA